MKLAPAQYVMSLRLPPPLAYAMDRGASQANVTLSAYIRAAIERALEADGIAVDLPPPATAPAQPDAAAGAGTGTEGSEG